VFSSVAAPSIVNRSCAAQIYYCKQTLRIVVVVFWEIVGIIWLGLTGILYGILGVPGAILGILLCPIGLIVWINVQEHWLQQRGPDDE
jgi:hypothetical protein